MRAVTLGEAMGLLRSTVPGALEFQNHLQLGFGGAESNVAIALAKFGHEVTWISRLGDDAFGRLIATGVRGQNVVPHVDWDSGSRTGIMVRSLERKGLTKVLYFRENSAASRMSPALVEAFDWSGVNLFHTSGITFSISESAAGAAKKALQLAREAGALTSLDVNFRSRLIDPARLGSYLRSAMSYVDIVFGSPDELALLGPIGLHPDDLATHISQEFECDVVIKRGPSGAAVVSDGELLEFEGRTFDEYDVVGAGDAFVGGYLATILNGSDSLGALEVGHLMGALSTLAPGDWESQPHPRDLDDLATGVSR